MAEVSVAVRAALSFVTLTLWIQQVSLQLLVKAYLMPETLVAVIRTIAIGSSSVNGSLKTATSASTSTSTSTGTGTGTSTSTSTSLPF